MKQGSSPILQLKMRSRPKLERTANTRQSGRKPFYLNGLILMKIKICRESKITNILDNFLRLEMG